jgi:hypothetical protein
MTRRTIRAVPQEDGRLELLEHVELPKGQVISITLDVLEQERDEASRVVLPTRKLGAPKLPVTRDEIYADLAR